MIDYKSLFLLENQSTVLTQGLKRAQNNDAHLKLSHQG